MEITKDKLLGLRESFRKQTKRCYEDMHRAQSAENLCNYLIKEVLEKEEKKEAVKKEVEKEVITP